MKKSALIVNKVKVSIIALNFEIPRIYFESNVLVIKLYGILFWPVAPETFQKASHRVRSRVPKTEEEIKVRCQP